MGLQRYHHAWEFMLKHILQYSVDLNSKLPAPVYINQNGSIQNAFERGMRADIFIMPPKTNELIVFDAKYYAARIVENSPGWSDLVKQFFYAKALQSMFPNHLISNAFIFPGENGTFKQVRMKSRVNTKVSQFEDTHFPPIDCYYISPLLVIEKFVTGGVISQEQLKALQNSH